MASKQEDAVRIKNFSMPASICFTMAKGAITGLETATIAVGVLIILLRYKINPALLVLGGAIAGVFSFMPK